MKNIKDYIKEVQNYFLMKIIDEDFKIKNFELVDNYYDLELLIDDEFYFNFSIAKDYKTVIQHYDGIKFINLNISTNFEFYEVMLDYCVKKMEQRKLLKSIMNDN